MYNFFLNIVTIFSINMIVKKYGKLSSMFWFSLYIKITCRLTFLAMTLLAYKRQFFLFNWIALTSDMNPMLHNKHICCQVFLSNVCHLTFTLKVIWAIKNLVCSVLNFYYTQVL